MQDTEKSVVNFPEFKTRSVKCRIIYTN